MGEIPTTTIFFEDYFESQSPLDSYDPFYFDPLDTRGLTDDYFEVHRGGGVADEGFLRWHAPTYNCPGCSFDCGTPGANCFYSRQAARLANAGGLNVWRHFRAWIRPHLNQDLYGSLAMGMLINNPSGVIGANPWSYFDVEIERNGDVSIFHPGVLHAPYVVVPEVAVADEWICIELARRYTSSDGNAGDVKAWINDELVLDDSWSSNHAIGFRSSLGFYVGSWSGGPMGPGQYLDFARLAWADGPIGCGTRAGLPPDETPDPDALLCESADDYDNADPLSGECGRGICTTSGKTRELGGWETAGAGFPSAKSLWWKWTAPRSGRFIVRTRASEIFNEVGVYRHTGATPPPLVAFNDEDPWDPDATVSAAVEFTAESGVEYRFRVASASDGWVVLDFGPPKPLVMDDGWSISEGARETRTREAAAGIVSGLVVQDDQIAAASNGAGAEITLGPALWGEVDVTPPGQGVVIDPGGALAHVRGIVRVRGLGTGVWHVGLFVNNLQVAHRAFVNSDWVTLEFGVVQINRGDTVDVRLYRLAGEAANGAQIAEWRLESLSHVGCNPYDGGPLEGGQATGEILTQDELNARFIAHMEAAEAGGEGGTGITPSDSSNYVDPQEWGPAPEDPAPPWEATSDPLDPGPGDAYTFQPYPPD